MIEKPNPWKTLQQEIKYETPWITVTHHDVLTPGGTPGIYGCISFKNYAVGIIALDKDYNTWIVGQYRYPLGRYSWEIPEGGCPTNEKPLDAAKRELKEEAGLTAERWTLIQEMDLSNSASDERSYTYVAQGITVGESHPEDNEDIVIKKLSFSELYELMEKGVIRDAMSVAGILKVQSMIEKGTI